MDYWTKLGGNNINMNKIIQLIYGHTKRILEDVRDNKELIDLYSVFITSAAEISKDLSIPNNSISLSYIVGLLIKMGVFSYNNKQLDECSSNTIYSKDGLDIVLGRGVCRHYAYFQKDIFDKLNIFNQKYPCSDKFILVKEKISGKANHIANVIEYANSLYVYDSYNEFLYHFIKSNVVENYNKQIYLYYKPSILMWDEALSKEEIIKRLKLYDKSAHSRIKYSEFLEIKKESLNNLEKKVGLIEEFSKDTYNLKQKILSKTI